MRADSEILRADSDHVADAVALAAREFVADLVVLGSRGLSDWQSIVRHSVSHKVLCNLSFITCIGDYFNRSCCCADLLGVEASPVGVPV